MLAAIVLGEVRVPIRPEARTGITCALNVLCWTLVHDHNNAFERNLAEVEQLFKLSGIEEAYMDPDLFEQGLGI